MDRQAAVAPRRRATLDASDEEANVPSLTISVGHPTASNPDTEPGITRNDVQRLQLAPIPFK